MRRGQASVEIGVAALMLVVLLSAASTVVRDAWLTSEAAVAAAAADRAIAHGKDSRTAALAVVPVRMRGAVAAILDQQARHAARR